MVKTWWTSGELWTRWAQSNGI